MISNKILTQDDKEKLANFLFRYLNAGGDRKKIADQAKIWIEKGESDNVIKNSNSDLFSLMAPINGMLLSIIAIPIMLQLTAKYNMDGGLVIALFLIGIPVSVAVITTLECGIYSMYKHISDKKYASACAEGMADDHNVKCYKELKNTSHKLINELLNYQTSVGSNLYPSLDLNSIQLRQCPPTAPPENAIK